MDNLLLFPGTEPQTGSPQTAAAPTEPSASLPDAEARSQSLDPERSFLVEAPAGSGKTGLLIQRFLVLLGHPGTGDPAEVLAITFTRDATAEMRERVLAQLEAAASGAPVRNALEQQLRRLAEAVLQRDRELGWHLLERPERLNIRTIDSLCQSLVRDLPLLSGAAGTLAPTDDAEPLYTAAAQATLRHLGGAGASLAAALMDLLRHRNGNLAEVEGLIAGMLQWREQWLDLLPPEGTGLSDEFLEQQVLPRLQDALSQVICQSLTTLNRLFPAAHLAALARLAAHMSGSEPHNRELHPLDICAGRNHAPGETADDLEHWKALAHLLIAPSSGDFRSTRGVHKGTVFFDIQKHHKEELLEVLADLRSIPGLREALCDLASLPPAVYPPEQWRLAKSVLYTLQAAVGELEGVFATRGACDFTEYALRARGALAAPGSQLMPLRHLLVDEMQDTSSGQYQLLELLTRGWDGVTRTVFLVGDPKQSIYLFRHARVERFLRSLHTGRLGPLRLQVLRLLANFRSADILVDSFNRDFPLLFAAPDAPEPDAVPYSPASPTQDSSATAQRTWHIDVLPAESSPDDQALPGMTEVALRKAHALEIRRRALEWLQRPLPAGRRDPWKIAVLVGNRRHLAPIVAAFTDPPCLIPFRAVDIVPLRERQVILDLLALTRTLLHPADRTAFLALLRTPMAGLPLSDVYRLAGGDTPGGKHLLLEQLAHVHGPSLSEEGQARLRGLLRLLRAASVNRERMSLAQRVERVWQALRMGLYLTPEQAADARSYFLLLESMETTGSFLELAALDRRLSKLYAAPALYPPDQPVVDLRTIHKAKGLEWDVVFLPALDAKGGSPESRLVLWTETNPANDASDGSAARGLLAPIQERGEKAGSLNQWIRRLDATRERAERKRLFYVASTRARQELHLFTAARLSAKGELAKPWDKSLLQAAWPIAEALCQQAVQAHEQAHGAGRLLRFPDVAVPAQAGILPGLAAEALAAEALAAEAQPEATPVSYRVPLEAQMGVQLAGSEVDPPPGINPSAAVPGAAMGMALRPEGGLAARTMGNTAHELLQQVTARIAAGTPPEMLLNELPAWRARTLALLRSGGLARAEAERLVQDVVAALQKTLQDPIGRWIVAPHASSYTEDALLVATQSVQELPFQTLRADRMFVAGPEPGSQGDSHLWVVDFKTGVPGGRQAQAFFAAQVLRYSPQMHAYERAMQERQTLPIRLALYFPLASYLALVPPAQAHANESDALLV